MPIRVDTPTRPLWLNARQQGIGASEVSIILGISPFQDTIYDLYKRKITEGDVVEKKATKAMEDGNRLEPVILEKYTTKYPGSRMEIHKDCLYLHDDYPYILASLDGVVVNPDGERGIGEAKVVKSDEKWAKIKKEGPPDYYYCQVQQQMAVMGMNWAKLMMYKEDIDDFKDFHIPRNHLYIDWMIEKISNFWNNNVLKKISPLEEYGKNHELSEALLDLAVRRESLDKQQEAFSECEARVKLLLSGTEHVMHKGKKLVSFTTPEPGFSVDTDTLKKKYPDIYEAVKKPKKTGRRFSFNYSLLLDD